MSARILLGLIDDLERKDGTEGVIDWRKRMSDKEPKRTLQSVVRGGGWSCCLRFFALTGCKSEKVREMKGIERESPGTSC